MKIEILQKRIEEKANERFDREWDKMLDLIYKNPIFSKIKIIKGDSKINLFEMHSSYSVFNKYQTEYELKTNFEDVKKTILEQYVREETDSILSKLDILSQYINQEQL